MISVIDKLSPINFSDKCCDKFSIRLTKLFFASQIAKLFFPIDFSTKKSISQTLPWHQTKQRDFLNGIKDFMDAVYFFNSANSLALNTVCVKNRLTR